MDMFNVVGPGNEAISMYWRRKRGKLSCRRRPKVGKQPGVGRGRGVASAGRQGGLADGRNVWEI